MDHKSLKLFYMTAPIGFALSKMEFDINGKPDFEFLDVNPAFERIAGLKGKSFSGKRMSALFPLVGSSNFDLRNLFDRILAKNGIAEFEHFISETGSWYQVSAWQTDDSNIVICLANLAVSRQSNEPSVLEDLRVNPIWSNNLIGVMVSDSNGNYLDANQEACRMTGYSCEELRGMSFLCLMDSERIEEARIHLEQVRRTGDACFELSFLTKTGEKRWFEVKATKISENQVLGLYQDITPQRSLELELLHNVERNKKLLASIPDVVIQTTLEGIITFVNESTYGDYPFITANHLLGKNIFTFAAPQDLKRMAEDFKLMLEKPQGIKEYTLRFENGIDLNCEVNGNIIRDDKGNPLETVVVIRDITSRKQTENLLMESGDRLRMALQSANQGLYDLNFQTGEFTVSKEYATMLGYDPNNFTETIANWRDRLHPDDWATTVKAYEDYVNGPKAEFKVEFRQKTLEGDWKWILSLGKIVEFDEAGKPKRMLGTHTDITQRKQAEEAIRQSEQKFRTLFENSEDAIFIMDDDKFIDCNPVTLEIYGFQSPDQILGRTPLDFSPDKQPNGRDSLEYAREIMKEAMEGKTQFFEWVHYNLDGTLLSADVKLNKLVLNNQIFLQAIVRDITKRKQYDLHQGELHRKLETLIGNLDGIVYRCKYDRDWTMEYIGLGCEKLTGYSPHELINNKILSFNDIIHPEYHQFLRKEWRKALSRRKHIYVEYPIITKNGETKWVWERGCGVFDNNGEVVALEGFIADITERKQAEEKLRKLSQAVEQSSASVIITDLKGTIEYVNQKFTEVTGYSPKEVVGQNPRILKSGEHSNDFYNELWKTILAGKLWEGEFQNKRKNGELFWESAKISPIINEQEEISHYLAVKEDITESKLLADKIRITKDTYESIINSVSDAIYVLDENGIFIDVNRGAEMMYGYTYQELIGKSPADVSAPNLNTLESAQKIFQQVSKTGVSQSLEFWGQRKNGQVFPKEVIINRGKYFGKDHIIATARDITERKRDETSRTILYNIASSIHNANTMGDFLEKTRQELGKLFDTTNFFVAMYNPNKNTLKQIIFRDEMDIFDEWDASLSISGQVVKSGQKMFLQGDQIGTYVKQHQLNVLGTQSASWLGVPITINNLVSGVMVLQHYTDPNAFSKADVALFEMVAHEVGIYLEKQIIIENLTRAKEEAEESEEKYKQIFDNTFDIMSIYEVTEDKRFRVLSFNPTEAKLIGELENYKDKFIDECIPPELYSQFSKNYESCINAGHRIEYEEEISFQNIKKNFKTQLIPLQNASGRFHRIIVISSDITETKQLTAQLLLQNESLMTLNADLVLARDRAEESDRLKSAFLANMSHEIRTPMNGILGFAELLKEPDLTGANQRKYIEIIEKSGQRMLEIINDIIDISKIEAGLMQVRLSEFNVAEKMEYVHTFFKPEAQAKGLKLFSNISLKKENGKLFADSEKFLSIITNLVKNAIKFTDQGQIELSCTPREGFLEFSVRDTGIGIPESRQRAIFDRFVQADIEDRMARQGAGLGLTISKAYVEMMGGEIWLESQEGKGSSFYFSIPYPTKARDDGSTPNKATENGKENHNMGLKVLIADDDETSLMLMSTLVKNFANEILHATSGIEVISIFKDHPDIDLILMDVKMPIMDGKEATKQIRMFNNDVIIIAQTAKALGPHRQSLLDAGCNDYITKPIIKEKLHWLIQKYFGVHPKRI